MTIDDIWNTYGRGYPGRKSKSNPIAPGGLYPSTPNPGKGAYGEVPGSADIPDAVSSGINRDLSGILSPAVQSKLQQIAATWGVRNGMPGSGAQTNLYEHDYLGASDAARQRGMENWKSLVPLVQQNNELAAAPNPKDRALLEQSFAQQMFNQYLAAMRQGGGGGGGGYRSPAAGTKNDSPSAAATAPSPRPSMPRPPAQTPHSEPPPPSDDYDLELRENIQRATISALLQGDTWREKYDPTGDIYGGSYPDEAPPPSRPSAQLSDFEPEFSGYAAMTRDEWQQFLEDQMNDPYAW